MSVGENIKKFRNAQKLTQKELGERCNIAESTIRRYELGKLNPKYETIEKIARALNTHALVLLDQISQGVADELSNDNITGSEACAAIFKTIYGEIDIQQIEEDGHKYYEYILGSGRDKIIIPELTYDNICEAIFYYIQMYINTTKENPSTQDAWVLIHTIKDMELSKLKELIKYAEYLNSKK